MSGIAEFVEAELRPLLEAEAKRISEECPLITAIVSAFAGSSNDRYVLNLECLLKEAALHEPDLVVLSINLDRLNTLPSINVDVSWGDPSGYIEAELFETPVPVSESTVESVRKALPDLFKTLHGIITRGKPGNRSG
jgi:hypothetical protein